MSAPWLLFQQVLGRIRALGCTPKDAPIMRVESGSVLAVDWRRVNIDDVVSCRPAGIIIRCAGNPAEVIMPLADVPGFARVGRVAEHGDIFPV